MLFLIMTASPTTGAASYTTSFAATENPISEGGHWINGGTVGLDWFNIQTSNGKAFGTITTGKYTDPTAILTGDWGPDQDVSAIVFCNNPTLGFYQEVELRVRSTIRPRFITGYEFLWRCWKYSGAYAGAARWNGPVRDFTVLGTMCKKPGCGVQTGDVVRARIIGNVLTSYVNGVQVFQTTDDTFKTGNPGIGFNYGVGKTASDFGFTRFKATNLPKQRYGGGAKSNGIRKR